MRTWSRPDSSLSPLSLTKTISSRHSRTRSNGSVELAPSAATSVMFVMLNDWRCAGVWSV